MELEKQSELMVSRPRQPIGKSQLYALLVDAVGNPVLDEDSSKQVVALQSVNGKLQIDTSKLGIITQAPVVASVTIGAIAAPIKARTTALEGRHTLILYNASTDQKIYWGGSDALTVDNGFPIAPDDSVQFSLDPDNAISIYAIAAADTPAIIGEFK